MNELPNVLSPDEFLTKVKPACEKFIRSANMDNLDALNNEMRNIENGTLDRFQSYILIPLLMKMDNLDGRNAELKVELILTLDHLIKRIKVKDKSAIKTILVVCLKQIYNFEVGQVNTSASEEMKTAVVQCMSSTFEKSTLDTLESFYSKENAGLIGKIAVTCVEIISIEKYRKLRIAAIECLLSAFYVHDLADFLDIVIRNSVADIVFVFLPKIVQTLISVANGEEKQGEKIISTSVKCLGRIVCLVFEDYHQNPTVEEIQVKDFANLVKTVSVSHKTDDEILGMNLKSRPLEERFKTLQSLERNAEWFGASSRKLTPILKTMVKLRVNSSKLVREAYAAMCCNLIEKCHKNLSENLPIFIENVFALSQDEDETVRIVCSDFLRKMIENPLLSTILSNNVSSLFEIHLISLPRIINRWDDTEQLAEFLFLKGVLENAGEDCMSTVLCVPNNLEKLCNCFIVALELELDTDLLKEEYAIRNVGDDTCETKPFYWRKYKNITNMKIVSLIQSICEILGRSKIVDLVFDHLIGILEKDTPECNEIFLMLIMMLSSNYDSGSKENVRSTLDAIFHERRWSLELRPIQMDRLADGNNSNWYIDRTPGLYESAIEIRMHDVNSDEDDVEANSAVNISDAQFNVMHTCLMLDAIGHFALVLEDQFESFMYKALHKVLRSAGSTNFAVHEAGMFALRNIQKGLKMDSVPDLIRDYSSYISYHVNVALKKMDDENSAYDILTTILRYSSFDSLAFLENILATMFEESSRHEQSTNIESFLKVFHMTLLGLSKWYIASVKNERNMTASQPDCEQSSNPTDIYEKWIATLNNHSKIADETNFEDIYQNTPAVEISPPNENQDEIEQDEEPIAKKSLPQHIEIVVKILKEVVEFISSKNQMHKIISLECIATGLPIICDYENELLPIVHLIWYPFAERFKEKDVIVLNRCLTVLEVLATHAKDFLLQRTLKDIFPLLSEFLREASKNSHGKTYLVQRQEFKLQLKLLNEYPTLIESMEVHEKEMDRISEVVLLYLNRKQPKLLQDYAIEYFRRMCIYNCPAVYIKITFHLSNDDMKENIMKIIEFINGT